MAEPQNAESVPFRHTCITCHVVFAQAQAHRDHFKSDWHRYNLKRKIAEMEPISCEAFQIKNQQMSEQINGADAAENVSKRCVACQKFYQTGAAFDNHLKSRKHLEAQAKLIKDMELKSLAMTKEQASSVTTMTEESAELIEVDDDEDLASENSSLACGLPIPVETCLFCNQIHKDVHQNLEHMSLKHGFFIVDAEYCINLDGLMIYLGQKVGEGFVCLWCNERGRRFRSLDAVQKHMVDKSHCKMFHDGSAMLEYSDFYDYSSSYPDADQAAASDLDDDIDLPALEERGYELILPSGATIGHRSLHRYFKQNLRPSNQLALSSDKSTDLRSAIKRENLLAQYRQAGLHVVATAETIRRKRRDLAYVQKVLSKQHMRLGVKANKLQAHFRSQIGF